MREREIMAFEIGEHVWVKCAGSDAWGCGVVVGFTPKRIKVINHGRINNDVVCVAPHNVKKVEVA